MGSLVEIVQDKIKIAVIRAHHRPFFTWFFRIYSEQMIRRNFRKVKLTGEFHDKGLPDKIFVQFLKVIKNNSQDDRNFVRKAVNCALRQIGKSRNLNLYNKALKLSEELAKSTNKTEHWIGQNANTELKAMRLCFQ